MAGGTGRRSTRPPCCRVPQRRRLRTRIGKEWSYARVHSMRKQHGIPTGCPLKPDPAVARADGLVSSKAAAERLQVSPSLVNLWVKHGVLVHDQRIRSSKVWVRLTEQDFARLTGACPEATDLPTFRSIMLRTGVSPSNIWKQVSEGHYLRYRIRHGQTWQWHLSEIRTAPAQPQALPVRRSRKGGIPYE